MSWPIVSLGEVSSTVMGQAPPGADCNTTGRGTIFVKAGEFFDRYPVVREWTTNPLKLARAGDVLVCVVGATAGKINLAIDCAIGRSVAAVRPQEDRLDTNYLYRFLETRVQQLRRNSQGLAQGVITREMLSELKLALPPLNEQRQIAAILDHADALGRKRQQSFQLLASLPSLVFLEMFGDPARLPKEYPKFRLGNAAINFSDGPFGSNLKSEHYVDEGVRVVRLQNIGINEFVDRDTAYISASHFQQLKKHTCLPGDVLIGTLGNPNLRACIQPSTIPLALNKADCVQMRVNKNICTAEYVVTMLNLQSVERMAQSSIQGQTRLRISMGRLRELELPFAPIDQQRDFSKRFIKIETLKADAKNSMKIFDSLFASLQRASFAGRLPPTYSETTLTKMRKLAAE